MFLYTFKDLDPTTNFEVNQEERATINITVNISEAMASGGARINDGKCVTSLGTMNALGAEAKCALTTSVPPLVFIASFPLLFWSNVHYITI